MHIVWSILRIIDQDLAEKFSYLQNQSFSIAMRLQTYTFTYQHFDLGHLHDYIYRHRTLATGKPTQFSIEHCMVYAFRIILIYCLAQRLLHRPLYVLFKVPLLIVTSIDFLFDFKYDLFVHFGQLEKEVEVIMKDEGQMPIDICFQGTIGLAYDVEMQFILKPC